MTLPPDTQPRRVRHHRPRPQIGLLPLATIVILAVAASVAVTAIAALLLLANMRTVTVIVDGDAVQTRTHAETVGDLLDQLGIVVGPADRLTPAGDSPIQNNTIVQVERARSIFLTVDGQTVPQLTLLNNPAEILAEAGVRVDANDRVVVDGTETTHDGLVRWPVPASHIEVRHAVALRLRDGAETRLLQTTAATVGEALFAAGITLFTADTVTPPLNTALTEDTDVLVSRARPVTIIADGESRRVRAQGETVADALSDADIQLVGLDYAVPAESTSIRPGMSIRVIRVQETIESTEEPIPYETVYQGDPTLEIDNFQTAQNGANGLLQHRERVRYENGAAVEREPLDDVVIQQPANHVNRYGTNVVIRTVETDQGPREYWRVLRMYATSYHPAALGGDSTTSIGRTLQKGIVGGDPDILPYGTQIYVPRYGIGEIADTGPKRRIPLWVDLGYSDADWVSWSGYVDVYILTPVPPVIDYFLMEP
ncbi:MAG: DUF348 domain-containing protein [Chloroflexi bacterium]|nr:DUF348 domain-containing protein [Chloroflexota bacterium]